MVMWSLKMRIKPVKDPHYFVVVEIQ